MQDIKGTGFAGFQATGLEEPGLGDIIDLVEIIPGSLDPLSLEPQGANGAPALNRDENSLVLTKHSDPQFDAAGGSHLGAAKSRSVIPELADPAPDSEKPVDLLHLADPLPEQEPLAPSPARYNEGSLRIDEDIPLPQAAAERQEEKQQKAESLAWQTAQKVPCENVQPVNVESRIDALEDRLTLLEVRMEARLNAFSSSFDPALEEIRSALGVVKKRQDALFSEEGAQDFFLRIQPDVERAAARSATQALREELSQLLELHKKAPKKPPF